MDQLVPPLPAASQPAPPAIRETPFHRHELRLVRGLDASYYFLVLTCLFMLHCLATRNAGWSTTRYAFLPLVTGLCLGALWLPAALPVRPHRGCSLFRLKAAALCMTGLCPFIPWWGVGRASLYLAFGGCAAIVTAIWYLLELTAFIVGVFAYYQRPRLRLMAVSVYSLLLYAGLVPALGVIGLFLWGMLRYSHISIEDLPVFWGSVPAWIYYIISLPAISLVWLAGYARQAPLYYLRQYDLALPIKET